MSDTDYLIDFITGNKVPDIGAEANRQLIEKFLVENKGYAKEDIEVDAEIRLDINGEPYVSHMDLIVRVNDKRFMAFKCVAGSIGSWEREILAAARLIDSYQIPYSIVTDANTAAILDTVSGQKAGEGMDGIFSKPEAQENLKHIELEPFPEKKRQREMIIFRSYDSDSVNVKK